MKSSHFHDKFWPKELPQADDFYHLHETSKITGDYRIAVKLERVKKKKKKKN